MQKNISFEHTANYDENMKLNKEIENIANYDENMELNKAIDNAAEYDDTAELNKAIEHIANYDETAELNKAIENTANYDETAELNKAIENTANYNENMKLNKAIEHAAEYDDTAELNKAIEHMANYDDTAELNKAIEHMANYDETAELNKAIEHIANYDETAELNKAIEHIANYDEKAEREKTISAAANSDYVCELVNKYLRQCKQQNYFGSFGLGLLREIYKILAGDKVKPEVLSILKECEFKNDILSQDELTFLSKYINNVFALVLSTNDNTFHPANGFIQPQEVTKFMCEIASFPQNVTVYNPFAGANSYSITLPNHVVGEELNPTAWALGQIRLFANSADERTNITLGIFS